ncbi:MAG: Mur ligase family protein [Muribaculaceae bacterium]|nr:Mur ligase family protein [Muribaculaceae bacterium]
MPNKKFLLNDICDVLGVENPLENRKIDYVCFREKFLKRNSLYFTIKTEGFNGYEFDYEKVRSLDCVVVTDSQISDLPCIIVENPLKSLYELAAFYRSRYENLKSVIVTGSVGKTSAKELLYSVLNSGGKTIKNAGSVNSTRETSRMMFNIDETYKFAVMELGLRFPNMPFVNGSIILTPDAVMITNIGYSHIENFRDKAQILEHKLSAAAAMKSDGILFLNGDDELMYNSKYDFKTIFFGIKNKECDYYAENIVLTNEDCSFKAVAKDGSWSLDLKLNVLGEHNILNALGAAAIARHFGLKDEEIIKGVAGFKTEGFRQNVVRGYKDNIIIADCYNATPESMISGFEMLKNIDTKGRKVAVLGHMMRLGTHSEELHRKTGRDVAGYNFDLVITYGLHAKFICEEVQNAGGRAFHFYTKDDLVAFLKSYVKEDDAVLFKGVEKFHDFQDLFYRFADKDYVCPKCEYSGIHALENVFHTEAKSMYFGEGEKCFVSKNADSIVNIKDLSILIGIMLILERCDLDEPVEISEFAASKFVKGTGVRFNSSNVFSVGDLCYAAMFLSSFEAVYALVEYAFSSWDEFENALNDKLGELGVYNTKIGSFSHRVSSDTYTTAYDMYKIICNALNNDKFEKVIRYTKHTLNNLKSGKRTVISTNNKLLTREKEVFYLDYYCDKAIGIKAENIYNDNNLIPNQSFASCVKTDSGYLVGVILGSDDYYYCNNSYIDMKRIFDSLIC